MWDRERSSRARVDDDDDTSKIHEHLSALIVDDDEGARVTLAQALATFGVDVLEATDGEAGWVTLVRREPELVVTHWRASRVDGARFLGRIRDEGRHAVVVMLVDRASEAEIARARSLGAWDVLPKPLESGELRSVLHRAMAHLRLDLTRRRLRAELALSRFAVFRSEAMSDLAQRVARVAKRDVAVVISGAAGTGKELVARALVDASSRAAGPFRRFNGAAVVRPELARAEFFGRSRSPSIKATLGLFREAQGGTVFLDEVAQLDAALQSDLLRVIRDREVCPVGGDRPRPIDVRILASTHRDLPRLVAQGDFREDLYQRLKVGELTVPSLSERPEDVAPLTDYFMRCHAEHLDVEVPLLGPEVRRRLAELPWPGNVRELRDTLERLVALGRGAELTIQDLNEALDAAPREMGLRDRVEAYERAQIVEELERVSGRRAEAARRLHLARGTLLSKMKKYGL